MGVMEYDSIDCNILRQNLIAVYQLQFEGDNVVIGQNDDLMLQICINNNGQPRIRKCKWIQRDINGGETEVDVRFKESRVGGLSEKDLIRYIQMEEMMQKSDLDEEKRQEIKNSLEENTFRFKDELISVEESVKEQKAWKECMYFVSEMESQITNDENYEDRDTEIFIKQLEDINEKHRAYIRWKEDYKKYTCKPRRSPRLAPNSAYNQTSDPFDSLFYQPLSSQKRYNVFSEDPRNGWHSNFYAPSNTFFNFF